MAVMSKMDYLNLSTDLRRISLWIVREQDDMVAIFMPRLLAKFGDDARVEGKKPVSEWFKRIKNYKKNRLKAAELALTLSSILLG